MAWLLDLPVGARRALIASLTLSTLVLMSGWLALVLAADGFGLLDLGMVVLFAGTAMMIALSFWSSLIGALLLRGGEPPPALAPPAPSGSIRSRVAVVMPICDEVPEEVLGRLRVIQADLDRGPDADRFDYVVLSDSRDLRLAKREAELVLAWREAGPGRSRVHYRRRPDNHGFKAGNVLEFCARATRHYDFMVILDADSVMSASMIRRLVRTAEREPEIGILQPLIVGLPAVSPFARIFQFGMRHGMRAYATGCAWWQADAGPFWGHNALVRIRPFVEHCRMPVIPGEGPLAGPVLSHDQLEAALMRAGGQEVRVLPVEDGSLEQTPPTLPDFVTRDLRWCQGNMQYLKLLRLPGLRPLGRLQLSLAIMLFLASPLWLGFLALGLIQATTRGGDLASAIDPVVGIGLFALMMSMTFAPKLIGVGEALASGRRSASYGGRGRLLAGSLLETVVSMLLGPIMAVAHTVFIGGLLLGRRIRWRAQTRSERAVQWWDAARAFWPQTVLGLGAGVLLTLQAPQLLPWAAPVLAGLVLAVPFAWITSNPKLGRWLVRTGLCATPEEVAASRDRRAGPSAVGAPVSGLTALESAAS